MRRTWWMSSAACAAVGFAVIAPAHAQEDVSALIAVIEKQPEGMDRAAWKEKRREAARKLTASSDRRAVPVLIRLAEGESFDIVGEIAIEGLGKLGDASAIPALERIAGDASRDRAQRELARKSLVRLGAKPANGGGAVTPAPTPTPPPKPNPVPPPEPPPEPPVPVPDGSSGPGVRDLPPGGNSGATAGAGADLLGGEREPTTVEGAPDWTDDVLGASETLVFGVGAASLGYDTLRERTTFNLDAESHYARRLERERNAWGITADADVIAGLYDPTGDDDGEARSRMLIVDLAGGAELRAYTASGVYGIGQGALATRLHYLSFVPEDPMGARRDVRFTADLGVAIGGGYGRVLDLGPRMRVQQLASVLERRRALGRPIDDSLARKLQATWWALRRDRTGYRQLTATVAILRDAGVVLGEPDAGTTYELLEVLRDPSFDGRPDGIDVQVLVGESYLMRELRYIDESEPLEGRIEMALVRARAARQLSLESDAIATLDARYRILAPEDDPSPWQAAIGGRWRKFAHGDHGELFGALDIGATLLASDDDRDDTDLGLRLAGELGWTWSLNRASSVRVAGTAAMESQELYLGASLTASYGFLDGAFALSLPPAL